MLCSIWFVMLMVDIRHCHSTMAKLGEEDYFTGAGVFAATAAARVAALASMVVVNALSATGSVPAAVISAASPVMSVSADCITAFMG